MKVPPFVKRPYICHVVFALLTQHLVANHFRRLLELEAFQASVVPLSIVTYPIYLPQPSSLLKFRGYKPCKEQE